MLTFENEKFFFSQSVLPCFASSLCAVGHEAVVYFQLLVN